MLKTLFFFTLFAFTTATKAQQISNQVVNSAGGFGQIGSTYSVTYAIGEPITTTLSTSATTVTQGFLQPEIRIRTGIFIQKTDDNCAFSIFPNPSVERIFTNDLTNRTFEILTLQGQIMGSYQPQNGSIDVSKLPQGTYLIRSLCGDAKEGNYNTLKFIKQ
jgi:Secretion system C-terminal sorting domain